MYDTSVDTTPDSHLMHTLFSHRYELSGTQIVDCGQQVSKELLRLSMPHLTMKTLEPWF